MKTITSLLVIAVFTYIVYKRRVSPLLPKNRKENAEASGTCTRVKGTAAEPSRHPSPPFHPPGMPLYGLALDPDIRYDVMVFNSFDYINDNIDAYLADRINAKLSVVVSEMAEKGCPYRIDFITAGTSIIVLVTYRIKPDAALSDIPSEDAF